MFPALFLLFGKGWRGGGEKNTLSQASMLFDAPNTGIYRLFASLYNILHKDVEQEKLSQASMPLATRPRTPVQYLLHNILKD